MSVSGSGGLLPAGTYYCQYSFVDPFGETLAGGESAQFTVAAGQVPTVTVPALPTGVQAINLYLTQPGGGPGTETLYATGITTTTFACSYGLPADQPTAALPDKNTTGWPSQCERFWPPRPTPSVALRVLHREALGAPQRLADPAAAWSSMMSSGRWESRRAWRQVWTEASTLIWANWPSATAGYTITPIGLPQYKWTLP